MREDTTHFNGKVFGIGFHKTGTTSLHIFLKLMGFQGLHWPNRVNGVHYQKLCIPFLHDTAKIVEILSPLFSQYETFTDVPIPALYRELDCRFPNSRFIMIERNMGEWWESLMNHWHLKNKNKRILDPYEYLQYNYAEEKPLIEITLENKKDAILRHRRHVEKAKSYFRGRPDRFLSVSLGDPDIAKLIANFLKSSEVPGFPRIKRSSLLGPPSNMK